MISIIMFFRKLFCKSKRGKVLAPKNVPYERPIKLKLGTKRGKYVDEKENY